MIRKESFFGVLLGALWRGSWKETLHNDIRWGGEGGRGFGAADFLDRWEIGGPGLGKKEKGGRYKGGETLNFGI